jgi:hypothetical protein
MRMTARMCLREKAGWAFKTRGASGIFGKDASTLLFFFLDNERLLRFQKIAAKYDGLVESPILVILNGVRDLQLFDLVRFFASLRMTGSPLVKFLRDHHI